MRALVALALAPLTGCVFYLGGEKACDASAAGSVAVTVSAEHGGEVPEAKVSFSVDGGEYRPCDAFGPEGEWVCGWEVSGEIAVRVEAEGYLPFEKTVFVEQGECHVIPKHVDAVLEDEPSVDCDDMAYVSVVATVSGASGEALTGVEVGWAPADVSTELTPCEPNEATWNCGWEVSGALTIVARADGHATEMVDVMVEADECHVLTERVDIALAWLPD